MIPKLDPGQRPGVPRRRHPDRRLRARRRLAAGRAASRSASARSSATPGWPRPAARCPRQSLVAVLSAAPAAQAAQGGDVVAGQPAGHAAPRTAVDNDAGRTYDPPTRLKVARALVEALPDRAGRCRRRARRRRWPSRWPGCSTDRYGVLLALRPRGAGAAGRRAWSPRWSPSAAKWLLVGPARAGRPPAVELVRLAQRAGRHLRRGGGRAVVRPRRSRARRCSTCGCG